MFKLLPRQKNIRIAGHIPLVSASRGNTVVEYALIGTLVVLVSIAAMQYMGTHLNTAMAMIKDDMKSHNSMATSAIASHNALAAKSANAAGQVASTAAGDVALMQAGLGSNLQTTGANGATEIMAQ